MSRAVLFAPIPRGPLQRRRSDRLPTDARRRPWHGKAERTREVRADDPLARDEATARAEAVLLIADEPLPARKIAQAADLPDATAARKALHRLRDLLEAEASAFEVAEVAGGFQLLTRPAFARWLAGFRKNVAESRLSGAARETLAIVAYRQPIGRADIEAIRGVHCGETLRLLMEKGYVKIAGRDDTLGRPVLYGTTKKFLQTFGLRSLRDLPKREQLTPTDGPGDGEE